MFGSEKNNCDNNLISAEKDETKRVNEIEEALNCEAKKLNKDNHDRIAIMVYRRLRLRHAQLRKVEEETLTYVVKDEHNEQYKEHLNEIKAESEASNKGKITGEEISTNEKTKEITAQDERITAKLSLQLEPPNDKTADCKHNRCSCLSPRVRAYRLAVADLFVEKALAYLEEDAGRYKKNGKLAYICAFIVIAIGAALAGFQMLRSYTDQAFYPVMMLHGVEPSWQPIVLSFSRAFTAYGMIVLLAVLLLRYGKAMLDQAERLMERRHALRQGRLFVHLNDGQLNIAEMDKAFNWNQSQSNAFANISTDAHAPWGTVAKELSRTALEIYKAGLQAATKEKISEEKETEKK